MSTDRMPTAEVTKAIATLEGTFTEYKPNKLAAVQNWLERSSYSLDDVRAVAAHLVEKGQIFAPNPTEIREALQELDLIPYANAGTADPRLIAKHQESVKSQAHTIARIRNISFRQAVEGIRDEQKAWLDEGIAHDYLDSAARGWHRDRIEACVQLLSSQGQGAVA